MLSRFPCANLIVATVTCSGIAKLGHTGARALATRGCASLVEVCLKIIGAKRTVDNLALKYIKVLKLSCVV